MTSSNLSAQTDGLSKISSQAESFTSHTTQKRSTMRTRLCKRNSLLSSDMSKTINTKMTLEELEQYLDKPMTFDDLERITPDSDMKSIENTLVKYCSVMGSTVEAMKRNDNRPDILCTYSSPHVFTNPEFCICNWILSSPSACLTSGASKN